MDGSSEVILNSLPGPANRALSLSLTQSQRSPPAYSISQASHNDFVRVRPEELFRRLWLLGCSLKDRGVCRISSIRTCHRVRTSKFDSLRSGLFAPFGVNKGCYSFALLLRRAYVSAGRSEMYIKHDIDLPASGTRQGYPCADSFPDAGQGRSGWADIVGVEDHQVEPLLTRIASAYLENIKRHGTPPERRHFRPPSQLTSNNDNINVNAWAAVIGCTRCGETEPVIAMQEDGRSSANAPSPPRCPRWPEKAGAWPISGVPWRWIHHTRTYNESRRSQDERVARDGAWAQSL